MDILTQFGVQPILLLAQIVNFLVLLYILNRFAFKPILKVLSQRQETIAKSLRQAEEIQLTLQKTEDEREKKLADAAKEGQLMIDEATKSANLIVEEARKKASLEMEDIFAKGRDSIRLEREKMQREIREELADLVVLGLEKVSGKVLKEKDQKEIVQKTIHEL